MKYLWVDLETTGLSFSKCSICEIGCIITNDTFEPIDDFHQVIRLPGAYWETPALRMHMDTGLLDEMFGDDAIEWEELEPMLDIFIQRNLGDDTYYHLAGSSVHFDHNFLDAKLTNRITQWFHHRHLDVSSIKMAVSSLCGSDVANDFDVDKNGDFRPADHRALADIQHSLDLFRDYVKRGLIGGQLLDDELAHSVA